MKYKFPVICPPNTRVEITQGFMPINNPTHDGIDFRIIKLSNSDIDNQKLSYGSQLVCPFSTATVINVWDFNPMNDRGNGIDIEYDRGDGTYEVCHFWHIIKAFYKKGDKVKEGDIIALMGNTGYVQPAPTVDNPYNGTHTHMPFYTKQKSTSGYMEDGVMIYPNINIQYKNPLDYFDINTPFTGSDTKDDIDVIPLQWAWAKKGITTAYDKLIYILKLFW